MDVFLDMHVNGAFEQHDQLVVVDALAVLAGKRIAIRGQSSK